MDLIAFDSRNSHMFRLFHKLTDPSACMKAVPQLSWHYFCLRIIYMIYTKVLLLFLYIHICLGFAGDIYNCTDMHNSIFKNDQRYKHYLYFTSIKRTWIQG